MADDATEHLRMLTADDLERVIEIDRTITGRSRRGFFEKRLEAAEAGIDPFIVVGTEHEGVLSGYAIARVQQGEFGEAEAMAMLDAIGVDPDEQHHGHGALLMQGLLERMKKTGIGELRTQADWNNHDLLRYFAAQGFVLAPRLVLECPLGDGRRLAPDEEDPLDDADDDGDILLPRDRIPVRSMNFEDFSAVVRIDEKLVGRDRRDYFERKFREVMEQSGVRLSLVVEIDGLAVGYVMARVDYGEFGRTEPAAVIDTIGVHPDFAGRGVGRAMFSQLLANLRMLHVEVARTSLAWDNFDLSRFLRACGFRPSQQVVLTKQAD